jgi:hypothetical protein
MAAITPMAASAGLKALGVFIMRYPLRLSAAEDSAQ